MRTLKEVIEKVKINENNIVKKPFIHLSLTTNLIEQVNKTITQIVIIFISLINGN